MSGYNARPGAEKRPTVRSEISTSEAEFFKENYMDLNPSPEEERFRDELRAWLHANVPEGWTNVDSKENESSEARFTFLRSWQKKMFDAGWVGIHWPKEYGGRGATLIQQTIFIEEL